MNSTQLHYREASHLLESADAYRLNGNHEVETALIARAQVHALLACTTALVELLREADPPAVEAVAQATGVLRSLRPAPTPEERW